MDKPQPHPLRDQGRLALGDRPQQLHRRLNIGVVTLDSVFVQVAQWINQTATGQMLEGPDANVTGCGADQNSAWLSLLPINPVPGPNHGQ